MAGPSVSMGVAGHDAEAGRSSAIESGVVRAPTGSATALTAAAQRELAPEISTRVDADVSLRSERPQLQRAHCDMDADEAEVLRRAGAWHARARWFITRQQTGGAPFPPGAHKDHGGHLLLHRRRGRGSHVERADA